MSTKFTPTIASLTRDLKNADRAASDRLAHCQRLAAENAELLAALYETVKHLEMTMAYLPTTISGEKHTLLYCECEKRIEAARAIIARYQE